jgi:cephalosporin hydroxylase
MNRLKQTYSKTKQWFLYIVRFSDKTITIFKYGKKDLKRYQIMIWQDQSGVCFKYGFDYGGCSCWKTLYPQKRPYYFKIPIFKTN